MSTLTPAKWMTAHSEPNVLRVKLIEALDLLDELVDDNLDTVTKQRVSAWKAMVRGELLGQK